MKQKNMPKKRNPFALALANRSKVMVHEKSKKAQRRADKVKTKNIKNNYTE